MCRGFQEDGRDRLRIRAFSARLSAQKKTDLELPDLLTLHYLPRINGSRIEINGSDIRPDADAFVTLHRLWSEGGGGAAAYASRERVAVCEGVSFEIYAWDVKVVKGSFRKGEGGGWRMECRAEELVEGVEEVAVSAEGEAAVMTEKVKMVRRGRRRRGTAECCRLEEIPEEKEEGSDECRCCECCGVEEGKDDGDCTMEDLEIENVRWAVDVGIWVVCLGVGYFVSRASSRRFRRKRIL